MSTDNFQMQSNEIGELLSALCKAQAVMQGAIEDSANPYFKSKYADLTSVWEACRGPLTKNGLSVVQTIQVFNGSNCLVSLLGHTSGQWIKSIIPIKPNKDDIQALGSAITYCRRYTLSALVGVAPVDDDGEGAMSRKRTDYIPKEEEIMLNLPADVDASLVEIFLTESAKMNKTTVPALKKLACEKHEDFIRKFKQWEKKQFSKVNSSELNEKIA
jgi:hypothetical protein